MSALALTACSASPAAPIQGQHLADVPIAATAQTQSSFQVVDVLLFKGKPDLGALGMLDGAGAGDFWRKGVSRDSLDEGEFRTQMRAWRDYDGVLFLDIESWPTCYAAPDVVDRSVVKFSRAMDIVREVAPNVKFGIYSQFPAFGYWPIVGGDTTRLATWKACNRRLTELAKKVDYIFPALYTYYEDEQGWDKYALATMTAAKQYGKPVYPFLWNEYHDSNPYLIGQNIPGRVWRHQLELVKQYADGVVLWNGFRRTWDENAPWWQETRAFLQALHPPTAPNY